ncbi:MAG TPA: DNA polymerase III subunit alpha [Chloroflexota bacterium]|nr:DNA polymerase III subunit alpha [Chloroflexota bacterium]
MTEFTHLHVHSDYSLLDGLARIPLLADQANQHGMKAAALTDHGVMFGAIDFYQAMTERDIKPIIGMEAYVAAGSRKDRSGSAFHLTLLAENEAGYANLMQLTTKAHLEGFYRKPRVDHQLLEEHAEGVICLSGCASSEISRAILDANLSEAEKHIEWYRSIYNDGFYLELQDHGLDFQAKLNVALIEFSKKMDIPLVATNDVHYVRPDQAPVHDVLLCVQTQTTMSDPKRMKMESRQFYLKSPEEMDKLFGHVDGAIQNTMAIAERCALTMDFGEFHLLPKPAVPDGVDHAEYLRTLCDDGIHRRFGTDLSDEVRRRLSYELEIIEKTHYVDYMLLVNEFIGFAKSNDIAIGVRGSAGGSIVGYALGVTNVDPMLLGLSFERFLNPERVSMPDVDIDIADDRRDELIQYVTKRFGRDHVAQIISFGTMAARAALRDVGRATGVQLTSVDRVAKLVPFNANLTDALEKVPDFKAMYDQDPIIHQLIDTSRELEGVTRHASTHAAGIVISADPLAKHVPLYRVPKGEAVTTQYAMSPLEKLGLLKMDFLGLTTLTVVQRAVRRIVETTGHAIDLDAIPVDDPKIYELLGRGETFGIFQVDGSGMRRLLRQMQPDRFDDIIALIALFRPGPMEFIDEFVKRRSGDSPITYPHPSLATALADTYGIVVYQEQIVRMVVEVAGFSMGQADLVRKAMAKKQPEVLARYRADFVKGAVALGTKPDVADQLFNIIQGFAGYGFNKAHSAAYAVITCQTAYLKAYYPVQYMAAFLSAVRENAVKVGEALGECRRLRIAIRPPDVNSSLIDFSIEGQAIRFGLGAVKNVGSAAAESIVRERESGGSFASVGDLCRRLDWQQVNKRTLESLIKCGGLDQLGERGRLVFNLDRLVSYGTKAARDAASGQVSLFGEEDTSMVEPQLEPGSEGEQAEWLKWEKDMIGAYLSHHPLDRAVERLTRLGVKALMEIDAESDGESVTIGGILAGTRPFTTRKGDQMATATLDDLDSGIDVIFWPRVYRRAQEHIFDESIVVISGVITVSDGRPELRAETVLPLDGPAVDELLLEAGLDEDVDEEGPAPPDPIPFPGAAPPELTAPPGTGARLVIGFHLGQNRQGDLHTVEALYQSILRHPGGDRVIVVIHGSGRARPLQLPVDTVRLDDALKTEISSVAPGVTLSVEQLGA